MLREMIGYAAERLMELELAARTGAEWGEKSKDRQGQRDVFDTRGPMLKRWHQRGSCGINAQIFGGSLQQLRAQPHPKDGTVTVVPPFTVESSRDNIDIPV